jgi:Rieske Fe-S protein
VRDAALAAGALFAGLAGASRLLAEPSRFISAGAKAGATHTYAIPATDGVNIDKQNEVILVRWKGAIYAFNLACPHQNTALKWDAGAKDFQCPKHHSRYEPDGTFIDGRATRAMDRFAITTSPAGLIVDLDALYRQDHDAAKWTAAVVHV